MINYVVNVTHAEENYKTVEGYNRWFDTEDDYYTTLASAKKAMANIKAKIVGDLVDGLEIKKMVWLMKQHLDNEYCVTGEEIYDERTGKFVNPLFYDYQ